MSWRDSAIDCILEAEFCGMWEKLSNVEKRKGRAIRKRRRELKTASDEALFEAAILAQSRISYEQGAWVESESRID